MLASNGEEATFRYFFRTFRARNSVSPAVILSDRDQAQIKALSEFFPNSEILLCWWHVMHDFHGHLDTAHWKTAKPVLRSMMRAKTPEEHEKYWEEIKRITTPHFITYMETTWRNRMFSTSF
jgi:transposase-like protein